MNIASITSTAPTTGEVPVVVKVTRVEKRDNIPLTDTLSALVHFYYGLEKFFWVVELQGLLLWGHPDSNQSLKEELHH